MNFEYFLYQYLLKNSKAEVPDFGIFELTKESAKIDAENSVILPPKEIIAFEYRPAVFDNHLARYIAEETGSNLFVVQTNLKTEVAKWFHKLQNENFLNLENLGQFQLDDNKNVIKITDNNSDIFGLEEINIRNLKSKPKKKKSSGDYGFNKIIIRVFLSLIIVSGIAFYFFGDKELLFGKSSQIPVKNIQKTDTSTSLSAKEEKPVILPKKDTIKTDSIKPTQNAEIQKTGR